MTKEAIRVYHDLLNDQVAAETQAALNAELLARRCYFGTRPLCTVLRPLMWTSEEWFYLKSKTEILLSAFGKAHDAAMKDPQVREQLNLEPWEEALYTLDTGFEVPWTTSRLDAFFNFETRSLRFVEYNAETPAGMAYGDQLSEAFQTLDVMKRFNQQYVIHSFSVRRSLLASLLEVYKQWGGRGKPQIGIIDWADVPTLNEHLLCKEYFESRGVQTILADPRALEYRQGRLWAGDFRIDLIYKRVLSSELIQRMGLDNPIVQALKDHSVAMSNAFSAKLMAKKASFTLLSDEKNAYLFNEDELASIEAHIPWTRRVEERTTDFHGQSVDLLPFIAEHRDQLVLKPNDEYGGKGVTIGWESSHEHWIETLHTAQSIPYVVQERVEAAYEDYPALIDGKLNISPRLVDADPYIFFGRTVGGSLVRLSTSALLNVTAGGGSVVPTFVVEKRG